MAAWKCQWGREGEAATRRRHKQQSEQWRRVLQLVPMRLGAAQGQPVERPERATRLMIKCRQGREQTAAEGRVRDLLWAAGRPAWPEGRRSG